MMKKSELDLVKSVVDTVDEILEMLQGTACTLGNILRTVDSHTSWLEGLEDRLVEVDQNFADYRARMAVEYVTRETFDDTLALYVSRETFNDVLDELDHEYVTYEKLDYHLCNYVRYKDIRVLEGDV